MLWEMATDPWQDILARPLGEILFFPNFEKVQKPNFQPGSNMTALPT